MTPQQRVTVTPVNPPGPGVVLPLGDGPVVLEHAGDGGWSAVDRSRRKALTEWNGYGPVSLIVPVLFDGFLEDRSVEPEIDTLRRIMRVPVGARNEPAVCRVEGAVVPPISTQFWVVQAMVPGDNLRREDGARVRAAFTVTLLEYVAADLVVAANRPTPAAAVVAAAATPPAARMYVVKSGDTLWEIAVRYLGSGSRWPAIADLNGVRDPKRLSVGQVLRLP